LEEAAGTARETAKAMGKGEVVLHSVSTSGGHVNLEADDDECFPNYGHYGYRYGNASPTSKGSFSGSPKIHYQANVRTVFHVK
jgi:hypothetical protein